MRIFMLSEEDKVKKYIFGLKKKVYVDIMYLKLLLLDNVMKFVFLVFCRFSRKSFILKIVNSREMYLKKGENKLYLIFIFLFKFDDYVRNFFFILMYSIIFIFDFFYFINEN